MWLIKSVCYVTNILFNEVQNRSEMVDSPVLLNEIFVAKSK